MRKLLTPIVFTIALAFLAGCATAPMSTTSQFKPDPLDLSQYPLKVDSFVVILDASQSMNEDHGNEAKFDTAKELVSRMIRTLPQKNINSGLRTFGHGFCGPRADTELIYGMTQFSHTDFQAALGSVTCAGGNSPLAGAIEAAGSDVGSKSGQTAVIAFSDGKQMLGSPADAVRELKAKYGDNLCMYSVIIGDDPAGAEAMQAAAAAGECGFAVSGESIHGGKNMADFITKVFLNLLDTDGDGVPDSKDKCPGTPAGVEVDEMGCPPDSDADGVGDYMDKCPETPVGANVNTVGCWVVANIQFALDHWRVNSSYFKDLDSVVRIMNENPGMKAEIQGHTDNIGPAKYNQTLSEKRAHAVMSYLTHMGIRKERLTAKGYGLSRPVATNDTPEGRQENRRVEITPIK